MLLIIIRVLSAILAHLPLVFGHPHIKPQQSDRPYLLWGNEEILKKRPHHILSSGSELQIQASENQFKYHGAYNVTKMTTDAFYGDAIC